MICPVCGGPASRPRHGRRLVCPEEHSWLPSVLGDMFSALAAGRWESDQERSWERPSFCPDCGEELGYLLAKGGFGVYGCPGGHIWSWQKSGAVVYMFPGAPHGDE